CIFFQCSLAFNQGKISQYYVKETKKLTNILIHHNFNCLSFQLWCIFHRPELVRPSLEDSLKKLQLDYIDLYIIHFPTALKPGEEIIPTDEHGKTIFDTVDICATWEAMKKCKDAGSAKSIGVSIFNRRQLEMILNKPGLKYRPVGNQVRTLSLFSFCYYPLLILLPRV
uniref:NADP-dependent oxidoreductase domain-containing protein n=1 Tax=Oryctolagus cuniculus TaxID=9986 RepID=G1TT91_RABIT